MENIIAHWSYSREEWSAFQRWKIMRKGILHYMLYWLRLTKRVNAPIIIIMPDKIITNNDHEPFHDRDCRLRKIDIRDAGELNVMEISYFNGETNNEIRIPIPKGKLREAIAVQERITSQASLSR